MTSANGPHILMTTDAVGGVWWFASELAPALCDMGHEVTLVVMGPAPNSEQLCALRRPAGFNLEITDLALEWMDPDGRDMARARHVLHDTAHRVRPDLVHLNSYREACFDWSTPVLVTGHSCVMSWWQACHGTL